VALAFGDVLFTLINVARFVRIHPEPALADSIRKFEKRFRQMEKAALNNSKRLRSMHRDEKERFWEAARKRIS
jgi:uncharacterized protein YabN with tetrapyrrole methylase and pyrophosphatase domain